MATPAEGTWAGTLTMSRPLTKVIKGVAGMASDGSKEKDATVPGAAGLSLVSLRVGKAWNGSGGFDSGQDLMKADAMVKMAFGGTAVPTGLGDAASPMAVRWTDWCRPSATRIAPAAARMSLDVMTGAPPR